MQDRRELSWLLSWYRHSELDGALLLGRMLRQVRDPALFGHLARHCADEARHAWLWQRTIERLGLPPVRIFRSYQSFYGATPQTLPEVLALTHVFERRVDREFAGQLRSGAFPHAVNITFRALLADEERHLAWIREWLARHSGGQALVAHYGEMDARAHAGLVPYRERLWDLPGLGEEVHDASAA